MRCSELGDALRGTLAPWKDTDDENLNDMADEQNTLLPMLLQMS